MQKDTQPRNPIDAANLPTRMTIHRLTDSIREMAGRLAMPGAHDFAAKMHSDAIRAGTLVIVEPPPPPEPAPSVSVTVDAPEQTPSTPSDAPPKGEAPPAVPPKRKPAPKPRGARPGLPKAGKAKQTA